MNNAPAQDRVAEPEASEDRSGAGAFKPIALANFLDQVAGLLRAGLPERLWVEATVVSVRSSASGFTLELSDAVVERQSANLRVFLSHASLGAIRRDLGLPVDPMMLAGMTTSVLIAPLFTRRWHLGGRVEALARSIAGSLRQRLLERTIAALKAEGLWDRQRALPRPRDVTRIVVIHPTGAAGWADIAVELDRWQRAGILRVRSQPTPFEGDRAAVSIAAALADAAQPIDDRRPDLVLLVRGGGARTSLAALDDEAVARAILACPVPVICGTGHASDITLADQVAISADTPSKALGLIAGIITRAAHGARDDLNTILTTASALVVVHERQLGARHGTLIADFERAGTAAMGELAKVWSVILIEAARQRERIGRLGDGAAVLNRAVRLAAITVVEAEQRNLGRIIGDSLDRAWRAAGRHDSGAALLGVACRAASTRLDRYEAQLAQLHRSVAYHAENLLRDADIQLIRLAAAIEGSDMSATLRQGFALVLDADGRLVPTRARAADQRRLIIHFADGALETAQAHAERKH